jgi:NADH-quinone oxidoreductase subunit C
MCTETRDSAVCGYDAPKADKKRECVSKIKTKKVGVMREYKNRKNVQAKAYYSDRFFKAPPVPRSEVDIDEVFAKHLSALKKAKVKPTESYIEAGQLVIWIKPEDNRKTLEAFKEIGYTFLSEMSAVDFLEKRGEFEIFYQLLNMNERKRARVKLSIKEGEAIESVMDIYKSADWAEREMFDMFGIVANNHPYLKRILMPDDWQGHPLLKSYPLHGDEAAQWYEIDKIFGKEYRDVVGPENRDSKYIDPKDTKNFARIKHEVPYGAKPSSKPTDFGKFQEDDGVPFITDFNKEPNQLNDRK